MKHCGVLICFLFSVLVSRAAIYPTKNPNVAFVRTNGNNTTGTVGESGLPFATVNTAAAACSFGQVVSIGIGTFPIDNLILKDGVSLIGSGRKVTILYGSNTAAPSYIYVTNNNVIQSLTITASTNNGSTFTAFTPLNMRGSPTNYIVNDCEIYGATDIMGINSGSLGSVNNCFLQGYWDGFTVDNLDATGAGSGGRFDLNACVFKMTVTTNTSDVLNSAGVLTAITADKMPFFINSCLIVCSNSIPSSRSGDYGATCTGINNNGANLNIANTAIYISTNTFLSPVMIAAAGGTTTINGHPYPQSLTTGTITWQGDATNAIVTGGFVSTRASGDRYWTTSGASLTNIPGSALTSDNVTNFTVYASGTAYTLTATPALVHFGTTDPSATINQAGTYLIYCGLGVKYSGATYAGAQTITVKLRRTNNTAADLTGASRAVELPVLTTFTGGDSMTTPTVVYTATSGDIIQLFGSVSATPAAGSVLIDSAEIIAIRLY